MVEIVDDFTSPMTHSTIPMERYDYIPIKPYWFYSKKTQDQELWIPFSLLDVEKLEQAYSQNQEIISTNGNRYDVNLIQHTHTPIYWSDKPNEIRRSKWFYSIEKDKRFIPFNEQMNEILENLYFDTCENQLWHIKHEINNGNEIVIFDNPNEMIIQTKLSTEIRILKRGLPETFFNEIPSDEKDSIQHLCFVVHGIGPVCDIKFRSLIECVEDFRQTSRMIVQSHFKSYEELNRVEFLPIYWHDDLHLDTTGVDNYLSPLTLPSIMKIRSFINSTLVDILFYTSPVYCQRIVTKCVNEMNRIYNLFLQRNPSFNGQISVIGHSLGSVILYDILSNQIPVIDDDKSLIKYEKLKFPVGYFFALGSPLAMFLTVRGITSISSDFTLPTCKGLLNIFHPCDPIAYRLEPLIDPGWTDPPVLLSHYKGRKRIHLELADGFTKATDITQKIFGVFKNIKDFVGSYKNPVESTTTTTTADDEDTHVPEWDNRPIGKLNQGRRIDYVLQHRPIEIINEYVFSFLSHVSYWCSEDTMLLIMKEILELDGFQAETKYETIEQMIKSNVLNCFKTNPTRKIDELRPYTVQ